MNKITRKELDVWIDMYKNLDLNEVVCRINQIRVARESQISDKQLQLRALQILMYKKKDELYGN